MPRLTLLVGQNKGFDKFIEIDTQIIIQGKPQLNFPSPFLFFGGKGLQDRQDV